MSVTETIKRVHVDPLFFRRLPTKTKREVVGFLRDEGFLPQDVARTCSISVSSVYRLYAHYLQAMTRWALRNPEKAVGKFLAAGTHIKAKAMRQNNLELCWKIERDTLDRLMALKILDSKEEGAKVEFNLNLDPSLLEAEIAEDLTLLERIKSRGGEIIDVEARERAGGASGNAGGNGQAQSPSTNGDESSDEDSAGSSE